MRSLSVVIETPDLDNLASFDERFGRMLIEAFFAELAVEALDESVLRWLARRNMMKLKLTDA